MWTHFEGLCFEPLLLDLEDLNQCQFQEFLLHMELGNSKHIFLHKVSK